MNATSTTKSLAELIESARSEECETAVRPKQLRSNLRASCEEGIAFGGMVGIGETYFAAFALSVGLGEISAGLVSSVPMVAGGVLQLISPAVTRRLGSHKKWVLICAIAQGLSFTPLIIAALMGSISLTWMLLIVSFYWASGLATGPAWNTWMATIVPKRIRAEFFASRTKWSKGAVFVGLLIAGIALQMATAHDLVLETFAAIFAIAGACRLISSWCLFRQTEPVPMPPNSRKRSYVALIRKYSGENSGRLLVYLVAVQASVQLASPYFTPFMLKRLEFTYAEFVLLLSMSFLAKIISLSAWGRFAKRLGAMRLLWISGIGIIPMSSLWLVSQDIVWLVFVQIAAGAVWAAYELAFSLLFLDSIPDEDRTEMLTLFNLANTVAWVSGALLGGVILFYWNASVTGYLCLFAGSSVLRLFCLLLLIRIKNIHAAHEHFQSSSRSVAIRLNANSLDTPLLTANAND